MLTGESTNMLTVFVSRKVIIAHNTKNCNLAAFCNSTILINSAKLANRFLTCTLSQLIPESHLNKHFFKSAFDDIVGFSET